MEIREGVIVMGEDEAKKLGTVTHYYNHLSVGIVRLDEEVRLGNKIHFKGSSTDFDQDLSDMQFDHEFVDVGEKGQEVGIKVKEKVRKGDLMYAAGE